MRRLLRACMAFFCATVAVRAQWEAATPRALAELPRQGVFLEARATKADREIRFSTVIVSSKHYRFQVIDNPARSGWNLSTAAREAGAAAAVNGGYFTGEFRPVGLLVAEGKTVQSLQRAKLLSGIFSVRKGTPSLQRTENYPGGAEEAIQCGPYLVNDAKPVAGLNDTRSARRTIIAEDGKGRWALMVTTHVTLADAARLLVLPGFFGSFRPVRALNLDGGSSTGLWVDLPSRPFYLPPFTAVRDYLAIIPR